MIISIDILFFVCYIQIVLRNLLINKWYFIMFQYELLFEDKLVSSSDLDDFLFHFIGSEYGFGFADCFCRACRSMEQGQVLDFGYFEVTKY